MLFYVPSNVTICCITLPNIFSMSQFIESPQLLFMKPYCMLYYTTVYNTVPHSMLSCVSYQHYVTKCCVVLYYSVICYYYVLVYVMLWYITVYCNKYHIAMLSILYYHLHNMICYSLCYFMLYYNFYITTWYVVFYCLFFL